MTETAGFEAERPRLLRLASRMLAEGVGVALQVVLDRLTPKERVAFVLHDSFGFEFDTIARILNTTSVAARKLASRARAKVVRPAAEDQLAECEVVDAFLAAARAGDFARLLELLAPGAVIAGDEAAAWPVRPPRSADANGWPPSSTGPQPPRCRFSSAAGRERHGSTAGSPGWPSTSPWPPASFVGSTSAPSRRCFSARSPRRANSPPLT